MRAQTLVELLRSRAAAHPERVAYRFLADGESESDAITWGELDRRARSIAAALQQELRPGDRALLAYPSGLGFIAAFFGCLYAGVIAVPAPLPLHRRGMPRFTSVVADAGASIAITDGPSLARVDAMWRHTTRIEHLRWLTFDAGSLPPPEAWRPSDPAPGDVVFLQYTSGSTSSPRGVVVTHANLLENERLIQRAFAQDEETIVVGWLPMHHDMGLIGNVLQPLYSGGSCVLMPPAAFLQRPAVWLRAIGRYRATTSGGPDFAYALCAKRIGIEERESFDLSSWKVAFNGSEPVRHETIERFSTAFATCGFAREAFHPCYGLAEATLMVTSKRAGEAAARQSVSRSALQRGEIAGARADDDERTLVSSGVSAAGQRVTIVDPATHEPLRDGVGEIWVAGPSVAPRYWNRPEESAEVFDNRLAAFPGERFLRTGDLGFVNASGELFVTGRMKELIIIRGRNHYPHDIERTAEEAAPALVAGAGAAFAIEVDDAERLVLVHEVDRAAMRGDLAPAIDAIRAAVAEAHDIQPYAVVLIRPATLPKTTSGKVQRRACAAAFAAGTLEVVASSVLDSHGGAEARRREGAEGHIVTSRDSIVARPRSEWQSAVLEHLRGAFARIAAVDADPATPVAALGVDSLTVIELRTAIENELGVAVSLSEILEASSVEGLAALIASRLEIDRTYGTSSSPIGPISPIRPIGPIASTPESTDLTEGQRSLWLIHRLAPASAAYHVSFAARAVDLDVEALRRAFARLVARHDALRSRFAMRDGEPVRVAGDAPELTLVDAAAWDTAAVQRQIEAEAVRPFDLEHDPLVRFQAYRTGDGSHLLLLVAHHIVVDFWSLVVVMDELRVLYDAERRGVQAELPEPRSTYAEFARVQRELVSGEGGEALLARWCEALDGAPQALDLPADFPRPPVQSYRGAAHQFSIGGETARALRALARREQTTLFSVLLAAWSIELSRYSGQEELIVGAPAAARTRAGFENVVGYFANLLPLRVTLSAGETFGELLSRTTASVRAALALQDVPFPRIVQRLQPVRDAARSPLFQAVFALEKAHRLAQDGIASLTLGRGGARISLGALQLESVELPRRAAQFDLTMMVVEGGDRLEAALEYNVDLFAPATIERMARHFVALLESIVAAPERAVSDLAMMSDAERREIVETWNATDRDYPRTKTIGTLFDEQVEARGDAIAVELSEARLTYAELRERADALAVRLRALGAGPGTRVAMQLERSIELVVAMLAIVKCGAAYVPLDPAYPSERLSYMLKDSETSLIVDAEGCSRIDAPATTLGELTAESPAYIIYTSGSTGKPKGVVVPHRAVVRLVKNNPYAEMTPEETFLQFAPATFDAATFEVWGALLNGARLVIQPAGRTSLEELGETIRSRGVTTLWLTAGLFHVMADERLADLRGVRQLLAGGDVVSAPHVKKVLGAIPGITVINGYGPTEATTFTCCHRMSDPEAVGTSVPIGKPIANTKVYVLDRAMQPLPAGVPGELYIGGDGLALGYVNAPELTAARFVVNPFGEGRLYRTGDRVRWNRAGEVEFLGRFDDQLKVRGFRVEPGEIESALREDGRVGGAVVVARKDSAGVTTLIAYVTPSAGGMPDASALRDDLRRRLPEHMVPAQIVVLDTFPLTANGKVDRRALPAPESARDAHAIVAPRSEVERLIAARWREALGLDVVGIHENLFDLGAHSLMVAKVHARLRDDLQREIPIVDLFAYPTIAALATRLSSDPGARDFDGARRRAAARRQSMAGRKPGRSFETNS